MKKAILLSLFSVIFVIAASQSPQGFSYQSVLYNSSGLPVPKAVISVKAGILSDTLTPVIVWEELHSGIKTNASGVFTVVIGTGTKQAGTAAVFSNISWSSSPLYLRIQVNYQNTWKSIGTSKLWSVPYALSSGNPSDLTGLQTDADAVETGSGLNTDGTYLANVTASYIFSASSLQDADNKLDAQVRKNTDNLSGFSGKMLLKGTETSPDSALFKVINDDNQVVFAIYNEGVRVYVDDGAKGPKGGFAVGGFGTSKAPSQNYLYVDPDSIRAYINSAPVKGAKGGFAVGGFGTTKGSTQDLLFVGADSIRAYIDTSTGKGPKGGFAVGGFGTSKGSIEEYLRVTRDSTRVYINNETPVIKGAKGGFAVGGFGTTKGGPENFMFMDPDSTRFYVREFGPGSSSTFNIVGINLNQTQTLLMAASTDTVGIGGVLNVQNNLNVTGNIGYTGNVAKVVPTVETYDIFNITDSSALVMGNIVSPGDDTVLVSGIVWSTLPNPTVDLPSKTTGSTKTGFFTHNILGLTEYTTYYIRAYATNSIGTGYGSEWEISTYGYVFDYDGNFYLGTVVGSQVWLVSNLKTTHLNDGTPIANVTDSATWVNLATPGYVWYNNDAVTYADYGILYNWMTVNTGLLCPVGWHVPSEAEANIAITFGGGPLVAGGSYKEPGTAHWQAPNTGAVSATQFGLLPGGYRTDLGIFGGLGTNGTWWTSTKIATDPTGFSATYDSAEMVVSTGSEKSGASIRCIKD
jgi:uncharacterized protein (TIGR02145 family)